MAPSMTLRLSVSFFLGAALCACGEPAMDAAANALAEDGVAIDDWNSSDAADLAEENASEAGFESVADNASEMAGGGEPPIIPPR